jgi:hypothetical protein
MSGQDKEANRIVKEDIHDLKEEILKHVKHDALQKVMTAANSL